MQNLWNGLLILFVIEPKPFDAFQLHEVALNDKDLIAVADLVLQILLNLFLNPCIARKLLFVAFYNNLFCVELRRFQNISSNKYRHVAAQILLELIIGLLFDLAFVFDQEI